MTISIDLPLIIKELHLDVPIYRVLVQNDCVELHLYGGKVVTWKSNKNPQIPDAGDQGNRMKKQSSKNSNKKEPKKRRANQ